MQTPASRWLRESISQHWLRAPPHAAPCPWLLSGVPGVGVTLTQMAGSGVWPRPALPCSLMRKVPRGFHVCPPRGFPCASRGAMLVWVSGPQQCSGLWPDPEPKQRRATPASTPARAACAQCPQRRGCLEGSCSLLPPRMVCSVPARLAPSWR